MSQMTLGEFQAAMSKTPVGAGVDAELLLTYINLRVEQITRSRPWTRLEKEALIQTTAAYSTGTVTIAAGATSGTGTDTVWTSAMDGRFIRFGNLWPFYTFVFATTTTFSITRPLEGSDDLTDAAYEIWQPVYELPSDLAEISSIKNEWGWDLEEASREWLDRVSGLRVEISSARHWVPCEDSQTGRTQIELYPGPEDAVGLPLRYTAKAPLFSVPAETSEQFADWISVPCVYAGVLADLYRLQDEQQRAQLEEQRFDKLLADMAGEDARKTPVAELNMADRYTQHRMRRTLRGRKGRNWNGFESGTWGS
jgi:hypothetical protein